MQAVWSKFSDSKLRQGTAIIRWNKKSSFGGGIQCWSWSKYYICRDSHFFSFEQVMALSAYLIIYRSAPSVTYFISCLFFFQSFFPSICQSNCQCASISACQTRSSYFSFIPPKTLRADLLILPPLMLILFLNLLSWTAVLLKQIMQIWNSQSS